MNIAVKMDNRTWAVRQGPHGGDTVGYIQAVDGDIVSVMPTGDGFVVTDTTGSTLLYSERGAFIRYLEQHIASVGSGGGSQSRPQSPAPAPTQSAPSEGGGSQRDSKADWAVLVAVCAAVGVFFRWWWSLRKTNKAAFGIVGALIVAVAAFASWKIWIKPKIEESKAEIRREELLAEQARQAAEEEEKEACFENQFKIQNTTKSSGKGKAEAPLSAADATPCPGGGTLSVEVVPEIWAARQWNSRIPVLYRISCSKHGSNPRPTPEAIVRMVEYAKKKTPAAGAKAGENLQRVFDRDRIRGVLAAKTVADAATGKKIDVDPYSNTATATVKVSVDKAAYDAWTKELLAALGPLAVERKKAKAKWTKGPLASSPEELGFDRPARGRPIWIVKDAATLDADLLLFDDETWDAIRGLAGREYEFRASLALKDDSGETFAESESATFPGLVVVESWDSSAPAAYSIRPFLGGENGSKTEASKKAPIRFEKLESGRSAKKLSSGVTLKRDRGGWDAINDVPSW